jgi:hypothetical protein
MSFFRKAKVKAKRTVRNLLLLLTGAVIAVLVTTASGVYYLRHFILQQFITARISQVTGFRTETGYFHHDFPARFTLRDVRMYNPENFTPGLFARAPYFYIELDIPSLLRGEKFHIYEWRLIISELHLEKNKQGIINGAVLKWRRFEIHQKFLETCSA